MSYQTEENLLLSDNYKDGQLSAARQNDPLRLALLSEVLHDNALHLHFIRARTLLHIKPPLQQPTKRERIIFTSNKCNYRLRFPGNPAFEACATRSAIAANGE
jgi:hypothetical protein